MFLLLWLMLKCRYLSTCVKICHGFPRILMLQYTPIVSVTLTSALVQLPLHSFVNCSSTTVTRFYTLYYIPPPDLPYAFDHLATLPTVLSPWKHYIYDCAESSVSPAISAGPALHISECWLTEVLFQTLALWRYLQKYHMLSRVHFGIAHDNSQFTAGTCIFGQEPG